MADASTVEDRRKKAVKRKRACLVLSTEEKESQIKSLNEEMQGLFRYFHEMITSQRLSFNLTTCGGSLNASVAALMEESSLPLSKLVEEIHMKLKETENVVLTSAAVKSAVVSIGQRVMYGVPNVDADVLEDRTQACLWCWETRDLKLFPKSVRGTLKIRRICRKKIHERITAVSAVVTAVQKLESDTSFIHDVGKASEKLDKVLREEDIRVLVDNMLKNSADMVEKDAKREEKLIIRQLERNKREVEKEKKKIDRELQKEKMQHEREQKRLLEEAEKDERRREKEECEIRKQQRKQQEEAEKDQRRREREEVELKKQLAIRKQASIMERFLKRSKTTSSSHNDQAFCRESTSDSSSKGYEKVAEAVTVPMDRAFLSNAVISVDELRKSHLSSWRHFGHFIRSNQNQHWGIRRKPKMALFKELKLSNYKSLAQGDAFCLEKPADRFGEQTTEDRSFTNLVDSSPDIKKCNKKKQLLQFDKSHRPAFYGVWPKKSLVVGPRHPLRKDPDLDYDVDSDEEWEEEDPGESLSDCDKDDEEEGSKVEDEEESEDGFFVPDGYLSEDEGAQVERMNVDHSVEETKGSPICEHGLENDEFCALVRNQKYLHNLTEHALRKNQPLIIINLRHEKAPLLMAENLCAASKMEQACLQALSMRAFTDDILIEMTVDSMENVDHEACFSDGKSSTTPISAVTAIPESDLPAVVSVINSCSTGINKVVESLQQKFPTVSKSQLRNKVREISDFNFTNNRWQVKKDILVKLGLSISPEKSSGRAKSIAKFFSKRCLPPDGTCMNP